MAIIASMLWTWESKPMFIKVIISLSSETVFITHLLPFILTITMGSRVLFPRTLAISFLRCQELKRRVVRSKSKLNSLVPIRSLKLCGGCHSTEVAFALFTQQPRVQISTLPKFICQIFELWGNFLLRIEPKKDGFAKKKSLELCDIRLWISSMRSFHRDQTYLVVAYL